MVLQTNRLIYIFFFNFKDIQLVKLLTNYVLLTILINLEARLKHKIVDITIIRFIYDKRKPTKQLKAYFKCITYVLI